MDILRESMDTIFENPSSIFTTMTAMDFIYKGYEVNCKQNSTSARVACAELRRSKTLKSMNAERTQLRFRWFDALNNSIQARYTVLRGAKNIHDIGRLIAVNDKPTLKVFKEDPKCNIFNGTDKIFYPPLQKKRDIIWVYAHDACKSFPLRYQYKKTMRGVTTAWKSLNTSDPLMSPTCECDGYIGCSLRGTLDMYPCADVFVLASSPHFYLTEPSILNTLDGMNPIEHLHKGGIYFDLLTGIPILSIERVQVSWLVKRIPEYPILNSIASIVIFITRDANRKLQQLSPTCECDRYNGCNLRGTMNLHPCLDVFLLGSLPHFYLSEPSILNTLDGMNPTKHLHEGGIYFDLLSGVPILSIERFQVSWLVKRVPEYPIFNSIAGDLWIPLFWYDESFSVETSDLVLINAGRISKIMGVATGYIMIIVGVIGLIALALRFHYHTSVTPHEVPELQQAN